MNKTSMQKINKKNRSLEQHYKQTKANRQLQKVLPNNSRIHSSQVYMEISLGYTLGYTIKQVSVNLKEFRSHRVHSPTTIG